MIIFDVKLYFDINQDVKQLTELVDVKIFIWIHLLSRQLCSLSKREEGAYISDLCRVTSWRQNIPWRQKNRRWKQPYYSDTYGLGATRF